MIKLNEIKRYYQNETRLRKIEKKKERKKKINKSYDLKK